MPRQTSQRVNLSSCRPATWGINLHRPLAILQWNGHPVRLWASQADFPCYLEHTCPSAGPLTRLCIHCNPVFGLQLYHFKREFIMPTVHAQAPCWSLCATYGRSSLTRAVLSPGSPSSLPPAHLCSVFTMQHFHRSNRGTYVPKTCCS